MVFPIGKMAEQKKSVHAGIGPTEIGRAQACFLEPSNDMNPILIKPEKDSSAQIVIHGEARNTMDAKSYHEFKAKALDFVLESFQRLASEYEVIIVEGAGSSAVFPCSREAS